MCHHRAIGEGMTWGQAREPPRSHCCTNEAARWRICPLQREKRGGRKGGERGRKRGSSESQGNQEDGGKMEGEEECHHG